MKKYKVILPKKNHTTKMHFGDANHVLELQEVDGHLEGITTDEYIVNAIKDSAVIEEIKK